MKPTDLHKTVGSLPNSRMAEMEPNTVKGNPDSIKGHPQDMSLGTIAGLITNKILTDGTNILLDGNGNVLTGS